MPEDGLVMSEKLAEVLGARIGDEVQVEVLEGRRPVATVPIRGLVTDFAGVAAYMDIDRPAARCSRRATRSTAPTSRSITSAGTTSCARSRTRRAPPS